MLQPRLLCKPLSALSLHFAMPQVTGAEVGRYPRSSGVHWSQSHHEELQLMQRPLQAPRELVWAHRPRQAQRHRSLTGPHSSWVSLSLSV